eukprot:CAMPEP_0172171216 /NCGR_PEP_ID=MMETSP1050-20130122/11764_1 /TAXON_ID=233186 /ORGANISM="Cryptomonas curvata, Strain CCAP979/52" /LENGTH=38 /DNA_ID= /DNA_START= /DNA_END= /DNA_ORIENTATION=
MGVNFFGDIAPDDFGSWTLHAAEHAAEHVLFHALSLSA